MFEPTTRYDAAGADADQDTRQRVGAPCESAWQSGHFDVTPQSPGASQISNNAAVSSLNSASQDRHDHSAPCSPSGQQIHLALPGLAARPTHADVSAIPPSLHNNHGAQDSTALRSVRYTTSPPCSVKAQKASTGQRTAPAHKCVLAQLLRHQVKQRAGNLPKPSPANGKRSAAQHGTLSQQADAAVRQQTAASSAAGMQLTARALAQHDLVVTRQGERVALAADMHGVHLDTRQGVPFEQGSHAKQSSNWSLEGTGQLSARTLSAGD